MSCESRCHFSQFYDFYELRVFSNSFWLEEVTQLLQSTCFVVFFFWENVNVNRLWSSASTLDCIHSFNFSKISFHTKKKKKTNPKFVSDETAIEMSNNHVNCLEKFKKNSIFHKYDTIADPITCYAFYIVCMCTTHYALGIVDLTYRIENLNSKNEKRNTNKIKISDRVCCHPKSKHCWTNNKVLLNQSGYHEE